MGRWDVRGRSAQAGALLAAAVLCASAASVAAEVRVTDAGGGQLVVEAHGATVRQVLDALGGSRTIRIRSSDPLSRVVSGTYSGTLRRVLSRVLDGYDHVVESTASGIRLDVFGTTSGTPSAPAVKTFAVAAAPHAGVAVSSNVDLDDEARQGPAVTPLPAPTRAPSAARPAAPAIRPVAAVLTNNRQRLAAPRVSSNVDLDEETSQ